MFPTSKAFNPTPPGTYVGDRVGSPQCSPILGQPHKTNCQLTIRAMEGSLNRVNTITKYIPEADVYNNLRVLTDFAFDPNKPQLAVPRVYSQRDCAVVVKMVEKGDAQSDEADIKAVRQTALSIFDKCVGLGQPTDVYQGRKVWGGSGGWQVAGSQ
ncbi:MAG: hypothetical protein M1835_005700 [Candelina submexicana]|nr:MAG: hypothetical protein M1835_005700 [Candelina submexicana]